jgi:acyl carrier protein
MSYAQDVIEYFLDKDTTGSINRDAILTYNYMENNFFTSIEYIQMIVEFEDKFSITFSDEHFKSQEFSMIGGLIKLIDNLTQNSGMNR